VSLYMTVKALAAGAEKPTAAAMAMMLNAFFIVGEIV